MGRAVLPRLAWLGREPRVALRGASATGIARLQRRPNERRRAGLPEALRGEHDWDRHGVGEVPVERGEVKIDPPHTRARAAGCVLRV